MDKKELEEKIKAWNVQSIVVSLKSELDRDVPQNEVRMNHIDVKRLHRYLVEQPFILNEVLDKSACLWLCWKFLKLAFRRKGKSYLKLTGFIREYRTDDDTEVIPNH